MRPHLRSTKIYQNKLAIKSEVKDLERLNNTGESGRLERGKEILWAYLRGKKFTLAVGRSN